MKKVLLSTIMMLAIAVSFTSCKDAADKAKDGMEDAADAASDAADEAKDVAKDAIDDIGDAASDAMPSFESPAVSEYVKTYDSYMNDYKAAVESKDMTAFSNLGTKGQELAAKAQDIMSNLSADDSAKLTEYMTAKAKEMQELATKLTE